MEQNAVLRAFLRYRQLCQVQFPDTSRPRFHSTHSTHRSRVERALCTGKSAKQILT